ncbi:Uncharacterized protein B5E38_5001 [Bacillus cereus]|nr:Uncharacterized protein B5E38_5001 [Bacillus cereus]ARO65087.1 Uncharacterized protein B5E39_2716 [Bacillus cereus]
MKFYNCSNCGDSENELRAVETSEGVMCEVCAIKFHTRVIDDNKVYGALNLIGALLEEHCLGKLSLRDLTRSLDRQVTKLKEEIK